MADAYIGEIRAFAINFVPQGWYGCYGQTLQIRYEQVLYTLIGNTYGGSTQAGTFVLPNLQGYAPIGLGQGTGLTNRQMGKSYGASTVTLSNYAQLPPHNHTVTVQRPVAANLTQNTQATPTANSSWLAAPSQVVSDTVTNAVWSYVKNTGQMTDTLLHPATVGYACGNSNGSVAAHENRQPYLPLVFCICAEGAYPDFQD